MSGRWKSSRRMSWNELRQKMKMPALRLRSKLILYGFTAVFVALSLYQAAEERFPDVVGAAVYAPAAVLLSASCYYLVLDVRYGVREKIKPGIEANPFTRRVAKDYRYRTVMFAVPGLLINMVFAAFNGIVGIYSRSAWCGTLSAYYILLSVMRFGIVLDDRKNGWKMRFPYTAGAAFCLSS